MGTPAQHGPRTSLETGRERGVAELWVAWLEPPDSIRETLDAHLAPGERDRARRFVRERDARRFVAARAFLRLLLATQVGRPPGALVFDTGAHGKPSLAPAADVEFNLSHSGPVAVCAVAGGRDQVGVDVERVRAMDDLDRLAATVLSAREVERYDALADSDRLHAFFDAWTRKEALLKLAGSGLARSPQDVEVMLGPASSDVPPARPCDAPWLHTFEPCAGYIGALAGAGPPREVRMRQWVWM